MSKFTLGDAEIQYELTGSPGRDTLVLIPGMGMDSRLWGGLPLSLATGRVVLTYDMRGVGRSSRGDAAITVPSLADDVAALLDHLGIRRAHICGVSFGGKVALDFARRHAGRTAGLILAATHGPAMLYNQCLLRSFEILLHRLPPTEFAEALQPMLYSPAWMRDNPAAMEKMEALRVPSPELMAVMREQVRAAQAWLPDLPADFTPPPALILCGERDAISPPEASRALHAAMPGSRLVILPGVGHSLFAEAPRECRRAILEFLNPATDEHR